MTEQQHERATQIKMQLISIDEILGRIRRRDFKLDPPTRDSGFTIGSFGSESNIRLNEGEVVCIKNALESMKIELQEEFERL